MKARGAKRAKFKIGQVVAFKVNGVTHYERIEYSSEVKGRLLFLTEHGFVSSLYGMRPLTAQERGGHAK